MKTFEKQYDYKTLEEQFRNSVGQLEGKVLDQVLLQIVEPEINLVALLFEDAAFCLQGAIGGEVLRLVNGEPPTIDESSSFIRYIPFAPAKKFLGSSISQVRTIGSAWNGHGVEISFESHPAHTLVVQSIHSSPVPVDFSDCLRISVVEYIYEIQLEPFQEQEESAA